MNYYSGPLNYPLLRIRASAGPPPRAPPLRQKLTDPMISNNPNKAVYVELASRDLRITRLSRIPRIHSYTIIWLYSQKLLESNIFANCKIVTAGGVDYYSGPLRQFLIEDPGLCWTNPPQKLMGPLISHNPDKTVYMELGSLR